MRIRSFYTHFDLGRTGRIGVILFVAIWLTPVLLIGARKLDNFFLARKLGIQLSQRNSFEAWVYLRSQFYRGEDKREVEPKIPGWVKREIRLAGDRTELVRYHLSPLQYMDILYRDGVFWGVHKQESTLFLGTIAPIGWFVLFIVSLFMIRHGRRGLSRSLGAIAAENGVTHRPVADEPH